jgi:Transcriptional regulator, AbiEi antitoxin, Type IV TA system
MVVKEDILDRVPELLEELVGLPARRMKRKPNTDLVLRVGSHVLVIQAKSSLRAESIAQAVDSARSAALTVSAKAIALIVVPFMGELGGRLCRNEGVSYLDLSGNAWIEATGLRVHVAGQPNRFVRRGRPSSVFAPMSARVSRLLLLDPQRWWRQTGLVERANLGAGYVSRICKRLEEDRLIERDDGRAVRPRDPGLLLDAWQAQYDFRRHDVREGHISVRSGEELVQRVVDVCDEVRCAYALTGLAAAWLLAPFASYRLVAVYIKKSPSEKLLSKLKWHEEKRGANLWLVRPHDEGVFHGAESMQGMSCVSAVQAYLDLEGMPERSEEAAEQLRKERLQWQKTKGRA